MTTSAEMLIVPNVPNYCEHPLFGGLSKHMVGLQECNYQAPSTCFQWHNAISWLLTLSSYNYGTSVLRFTNLYFAFSRLHEYNSCTLLDLPAWTWSFRSCHLAVQLPLARVNLMYVSNAISSAATMFTYLWSYSQGLTKYSSSPAMKEMLPWNVFSLADGRRQSVFHVHIVHRSCHLVLS